MSCAAEEALGTDGLHELTWDACDELGGGLLVASPADARGRGIALAVTRDGAACDLSGATAYLVWRHREARARGCEPFEATDAARGLFSVFYPAAMAGSEGTVDAQVMLSWGDRALSTRTFSIRVEQTLVGGTASEDGFTLLVEAIKRYEEAADLVTGVADEARAAAAAARDAVEELRRARDAGELDGRPGRDGVDGTSLAASVEQVPEGVVVTVTDASGTTEATLSHGPRGDVGPQGAPGIDGRDGSDGEPGPEGVPGRDGTDGASPTARVEQSGAGATLTVTDAVGTTSATIGPGPRGETGPRGPEGPPGIDGTDGAPCTHAWEGSVLTVGSASGTSSADLRGPRGADGPAGAPGADGRDGTAFSPVGPLALSGGLLTVDLSAYATREYVEQVLAELDDLTEVEF